MIAIGCLVPVFINVAMFRGRGGKYSNTSQKSWIIVGVNSLIIVIIMILAPSA